MSNELHRPQVDNDSTVTSLIKTYMHAHYGVFGLQEIRDKIEEVLPGAVVWEFLQTQDGKDLPPHLKDENYLLTIVKSI